MLLILTSGCFFAAQPPVSDVQHQAPEQPEYVSLQVFYDRLSPYGQWVSHPDYGYIWIPEAGPDFAPYSTDGYWIMTDYGWMWYSNYEWGWAPFHYGRWDFDNYLGWYWIPGLEWGPAWVVWRAGDGCYGWAPMRPGITVEMSFRREYYDPDRWTFVRNGDLDRQNLVGYYIRRSEKDRIIRNSTVINNTYVDNSRRVTYIAGPSPKEVQAATGRKIRSVAVRDNNRPGQKINSNQGQLYIPRVESADVSRAKSAPSRIVDAKDVHTQVERKNPKIRQSTSQQRIQQQSDAQKNRTQKLETRQEAAGGKKPVMHENNPEKNVQDREDRKDH